MKITPDAAKRIGRAAVGVVDLLLAIYFLYNVIVERGVSDTWFTLSVRAYLGVSFALDALRNFRNISGTEGKKRL